MTVPTIGVNALIKRVLVNDHGSLTIPSHDIKPVFIWRDGVTPGDPGSAVLNGHSSATRNGVFDKLHTLKSGDVATTVAAGQTCNWSVTTNLSHPPSWFTVQHMDDLYHARGPPQLVFITCWRFAGYGPHGAIYHDRIVTRLQSTGCS